MYILRFIENIFKPATWQPLEILSPRFGKKVLDTALVRALHRKERLRYEQEA